jgi:hypothetical protein
MGSKYKRRISSFVVQLLVAVAINTFVWNGKWEIPDSLLRIYYCFLVFYSFRKTRICPLEIMRRTRLLRWPRAFRLMYGDLATRMMILYFSGAIMVAIRSVYVVGMLGKWIVQLL